MYNDLHTVFVHCTVQCTYFGNMLVNCFLFLILSISFSIQNVRTCLQTKKVHLSLRFLKMFQIHIPDLLYRLKAWKEWWPKNARIYSPTVYTVQYFCMPKNMQSHLLQQIKQKYLNVNHQKLNFSENFLQNTVIP